MPFHCEGSRAKHKKSSSKNFLDMFLHSWKENLHKIVYVYQCIRSKLLQPYLIICMLNIDKVTIIKFRLHNTNSWAELPNDYCLRFLCFIFGWECFPIHITTSFTLQECCICLYRYVDGVELCRLPCNHHFHRKCITKWLRINATCPLCKFNILRGETLVWLFSAKANPAVTSC